MKLQGLGIIFALIVLPIILVLSYYIELQIDTIEMQNDYDGFLLDATHNAMSSFEINTANEDLSSVSDSLRTIIDASSNIFINTLTTSLGMSNASKSYVEPYLPALLYTLYDGYYINAPTKVPNVLTDTDGNAVSVGDIGVSVVAGTGYKYQNVHITQEEQDNCINCTGHITYDVYSGYDSLQQSNLYIKLADCLKEEDYGQLLYLKKGETDIYTANINEAEFEVKNVLKTYMPYSARYQHTNGTTTKDVTVIYTLDNYVTLQGSINDIYYTKSGYLLPRAKVLEDGKWVVDTSKTVGNRVTCVEFDASSIPLKNYNQDSAKKYIESGNAVTININDGVNGGVNDYISITSSGTKMEDLQTELDTLNNRLNTAQSIKMQCLTGVIADPNADTTINEFLTNLGYTYDATDNLGKIFEAITKITNNISNVQYEIDKTSAVVYFVRAKIFSEWVYENLDDIEEKDLVEISGQSYQSIQGNEQVTYDFSESTQKIFDVVGSTEKGVIEVDEDSAFYTHKLNVIRNSIQYNLNSAMSTYNSISTRTVNYSMPVMTNEEWEKILTNVSLVSFMQGYKCGLKTYNNYKIVSSTNNELSFTPDNVYYVEKNKYSDELSEYHKINCQRLMAITGDSTEYIAFKSKDAKYDKIYDKNNDLYPYSYDHRNLACYECINDGNYKPDDILNINTDDAKVKNLRKAYYIGIGKLRNNLYKMNAVVDSQGYEVVYNKSEDGLFNIQSTLPLSKIKAIEIVIGTMYTKDPNETVVRYKISSNGVALSSTEYMVVTNSVLDHTITIDVDQNLTGSDLDGKFVSMGAIEVINQNSNSTAYRPSVDDPTKCKFDGEPFFGTRQSLVFKDAIKYIKVIYK